MTTQQKGLVIALDGPDGVGKTTQVGLLVQYLKERGRTVHQTRSSGGTPIGEALRSVSLSSLPRPAKTDLYISLAMSVALAEDIHARKVRGEAVVIDRSPLSTIAYNGFGSDPAHQAEILKIGKSMVDEWEIDSLILFTADPSLLRSRLGHKPKDYFENQDNDFQKRVHDGYQVSLDFLRQQSSVKAKMVAIDASPDIQTVHQQVLEALASVL
ncbi:dTMP kinase [Candidatus Saccharibacteria bacterium]|nr:dTMP kinase [Candidatus Saccharibacteria bacterium]